MKDPTEPIRLKASQYPDVDEGTACTQSSFKTGGKSFLFIGEQGGRYKAMFKLNACQNPRPQNWLKKSPIITKQEPALGSRPGFVPITQCPRPYGANGSMRVISSADPLQPKKPLLEPEQNRHKGPHLSRPFCCLHKARYRPKVSSYTRLNSSATRPNFYETYLVCVSQARARKRLDWSPPCWRAAAWPPSGLSQLAQI